MVVRGGDVVELEAAVLDVAQVDPAVIVHALAGDQELAVDVEAFGAAPVEKAVGGVIAVAARLVGIAFGAVAVEEQIGIAVAVVVADLAAGAGVGGELERGFFA